VDSPPSNERLSVGGWVERSAVLFFNTLFLFSLFRAFGHMRGCEAAPEEAMD